MAKKVNEGKIFESSFKESIDKYKDEIYFLRLKDSASAFGNNKNEDNNGASKSVTRFTLKNDFDNLMFYKFNLFCFELKSVQEDRLSFGDKATIKTHQINGLTKASRYNGIYAGFIINFRHKSETYFLHINDFNKFLKENEKKSINYNDVIKYGGILINQQIKKVKYHYYIKDLLDYLINNKGE